MSKIFKKDNGIRYQLTDTDTGQYTTIPYMVETVLTVVGPDILVQNPIDPNMDDFTIVYANVSSPVTANVQDLVDLMYCWISEELPNVITMLTDTPVVYDAGCNALQSFGNDLYWRGVLISGGGGGGITTADNGLNLSTATNVQLGGPIIDTTQILVDGIVNNFTIDSPAGTGGNVSIYMYPFGINDGTVGMSGTGGVIDVNGNSARIRAGLGHTLYVAPQSISAGTATNGQVLTLIDNSTGECDYQTLTGVLTADNGLNINVPGNVQLGGALTQNTAISGPHLLEFTNPQINHTWNTAFNSGHFYMGESNIDFVAYSIANNSGTYIFGDGNSLYLNFDKAGQYTDVSLSDSALVLMANNGVNPSTNITLDMADQVIYINGGLSTNVYTINASGAYLRTANNALVTTSTGAKAISIPTTMNIVGRQFTIKDKSGSAAANNITITPTSGTIDGAANKVINTNYGSVTLICDGTNFFTI